MANCLLARHRALLHRAFFDTEDRLPGFPVQDVHVAGLRRQRESWDGPTVTNDVEEPGRRGRIVVPEIVVNRLEVPLVLARRDLQRDDGIAKQVRALAVATIGVGNRRRKRHIEKIAPFVDGEVERPGVDTQTTLPAVAVPRVVTDLAGLWNGVEFPELGASPHVERSGIANAADRPGRRVRTDNDDVLVDERHRVVRDINVDFAAVPERRDRLARLRAQLDQTPSRHEDEAWRVRGIAGPIGHTASGGHAASDSVTPQFLPSVRLQSHDAARRRQIHRLRRRQSAWPRNSARRVLWAAAANRLASRRSRPGPARSHFWCQSASTASDRTLSNRGGTSASRRRPPGRSVVPLARRLAARPQAPRS